MKIYCNNINCDDYNIREEIIRARWIFKDNHLVLKDQYFCQKCGQLKVVEELEHKDGFTVNIGKFSSKSRDEKISSLKKRATKHYEQHIKPYKEHVNNEAISEFRNLNKK
jgi:hypothetical protein